MCEAHEESMDLSLKTIKSFMKWRKTTFVVLFLFSCCRFVVHDESATTITKSELSKGKIESKLCSISSSVLLSEFKCQPRKSKPAAARTNDEFLQSSADDMATTTKRNIFRFLKDWQGQTASSVWRRHLSEILDAASHPDEKLKMHLHHSSQAWTRELLFHAVQSHWLERSWQTRLPKRQDMLRILTIIDNRMHNSSAPPLMVAVFGGSVAVGSDCYKIPDVWKNYWNHHHSNQSHIEAAHSASFRRSCAWPFRLQLLADYFLGAGVVHIENLASGGTDSLHPLSSIQYNLLPKGSLLHEYGPDIIINAYGVNDRNADKSTYVDHRDLWDDYLYKANRFASVALDSRGSCAVTQQPIVIFLDEYFGLYRGDESIWISNIRSAVVQSVSNLYGLASIASTAVVYPFVYADSKEDVFSPSWHGGDGRLCKNVHFGMIGHQHVAFSIAFAALRSAIDFCTSIEQDDGNDIGRFRFGWDDLYSPFNSKEKTSVREIEAASRAERALPRQSIIRSNLTFAARKRVMQLSRNQRNHTHDCQRPTCAFAFVAADGLGNIQNADDLGTYLAPYITNNTGWQSEGPTRYTNTFGLVTHEPESSITIKIANLTSRPKVAIMHYMKSYGPEWKGSKARFSISVLKNMGKANQGINSSFEVNGYHERPVSTSHELRIDVGLNAVDDPDDIVTLRIMLTGGKEFKIMSLMLCDRESSA